MNLKTIIVLSIGTLAMLVLIAILMKRYKIDVWKSIPVSVMLTVTGTIGTYIWFFIEASWFGGRSYYGAVFIVPIVFYFVAKLMKIPHEELLDFCAPAECVMLAIMKYQCLVDGCCAGKVLRVLEDGTEVLFPSQIVELINAFAIMLILMTMGVLKKQHGKIYGWYLLIYGATRFALNLFRAESDPLLAGLPAGNLWSLIAVAIGIFWVCGYKIKIAKKSKTEQTEDSMISVE